MTTMENETTPHGNNHAASFSTIATTMMHSAAVEKVGCCTAAPGFGGCGGRVHAKASTSL
jgi:hypothetical protein